MTSDVPANFSIVTLGVADVERAAAFYRSLGWEQRGDLAEGITWFKTSGTWIGLFGHEALAEDAALEALPQDELPAYRGISLAINLASREAVDRAFERVVGIGGTIVKAPELLSWGGYSGYFTDPDGHLWEIAHNPGFPIDEHGRIEIGG
jgi:catechol 2,3-dioxygenase-like lactoylglutathione lyase family enzyme